MYQTPKPLSLYRSNRLHTAWLAPSMPVCTTELCHKHPLNQYKWPEQQPYKEFTKRPIPMRRTPGHLSNPFSQLATKAQYSPNPHYHLADEKPTYQLATSHICALEPPYQRRYLDTAVWWIHPTVSPGLLCSNFYLLCFRAVPKKLTHYAQCYAHNYCNYATVHDVQCYYF